MKTLEQILIEKLAQNGNPISEKQADALADKIVELASDAVKMAYSPKYTPVKYQVVTLLDAKTGEVWNTIMRLNEIPGGSQVKLHSISTWTNDDFGLDDEEEIDELEVWTHSYDYDFREKIAEKLSEQ